ncbi:MAG: hypothetical protein R2761_20855 [Acidimicrobiales bacterium]
MNEHAENLRQLLRTADSWGPRLDRPGRFDYHESVARFERLAGRLEAEFNVTEWTDPDETARRRSHIQDTVTFDYFEIPGKTVRTQSDVRIRVSNFFPLAMYHLVEYQGIYDNMEEHLGSQARRDIENALTEFGYVAIKPNSLLFEPYDGLIPFHDGATWFRRFFGYI